MLLFIYKFLATQLGFIFALALMLLMSRILNRYAIKRTDLAEKARHSRNAMNAIFTIGLMALIRSCLKVIDCTDQADLGYSTLDALPDIQCFTGDHVSWVFISIFLLLIWTVIGPGYAFWHIRSGILVGRLHEQEFLEMHGW